MPERRGEMELVREARRMTARAREARAEGLMIGLVPTMGALHEGHRALLARARDECDLVVASIFVNPTQFVEGEDYDRYPRTPEKDLDICRDDGVDIVFMPAPEEMYPNGATTWVEVGELTNKLEGLSRSGHFRGVTTVVTKLFNLVAPDRAYFGLKDLQQLIVIERMTRDLNFPVEIVRVPTVREPGGLAVSSRNKYLSPEEREDATCLHDALGIFEDRIAEGVRDVHRLLEEMAEVVIAVPSAVLDYVAVVDPHTLEDLEEIDGGREVAAAVAVWIGNTRLIDNVVVKAN